MKDRGGFSNRSSGKKSRRAIGRLVNRRRMGASCRGGVTCASNQDRTLQALVISNPPRLITFSCGSASCCSSRTLLGHCCCWTALIYDAHILEADEAVFVGCSKRLSYFKGDAGFSRRRRGSESSQSLDRHHHLLLLHPGPQHSQESTSGDP